MKRSSFGALLLLCVLNVNFGPLQAQNLQDMSSHSAVNIAVDDGTVTIFFESYVGDLNIQSTDENPEEPIMKTDPNLWCHRIDVSKDLEMDDVCFRNYIINNSTSVECYLSTLLLNVGQKLYYKVLPKLNVELSPDKSKVNRSVSGGTATIFFNSKINDLVFICIDENYKDSIVKLSDNLSCFHIDVPKEIDIGGTCNRKFFLKSPSSADYYLTIESIRPNQVLYYTVTLSNELEVKSIDYPY